MQVQLLPCMLQGTTTHALLSPGHTVLHVLFCTDMPSQKAPPFRGAGLVQVRDRFCTPRPQRTLQADQSLHDDQPPFTECNRDSNGKAVNTTFSVSCTTLATAAPSESQPFRRNASCLTNLLICCHRKKKEANAIVPLLNIGNGRPVRALH